MRVCLMTSSFLPSVGGAEVVVHNLATALVRLGHAVTVLAPRSSRPYRRIVPYTLETFLPGTLPLLNRDGWWGEAYLLGTLARLRGRFDVVNLHFALPLGPALVRHRRFVGTPILLTFHGTDIQTEPSLGYGLRLDPRLNDKIREATNGVDGLVANSPSVRQAILEVLEAPKPVFDIPNGVWVDRFREDRPRGLFRARIGVPADAPLVLSSGPPPPEEGIRLPRGGHAGRGRRGARSAVRHRGPGGSGSKGPSGPPRTLPRRTPRGGDRPGGEREGAACVPS